MKRQIVKLKLAIRKVLSGREKVKTFLPYSDPRNEKKEKKIFKHDNDFKKTQIGIQTDTTDDNLSYGSLKDKIETCPKCQYPLRTKPDISSPCPNCGFSGNQMNTVFDSGKTITINSLVQELDGLQEFKFKLIKEDDNSEIEIQSPDEPEVILNRSHLDAGNQTISNDQHIKMKYVNQKILIEDISSNGSSFIQAKNKMSIQNNTKLVIGNKIYLFSTPENVQKGDLANKTRKFGEFDLEGSLSESGFILTDAVSGKRINFNGNNIILNRKNLDPGNNSISGSRHTELEYDRGQWYVKDYSSNESTFVQLINEQLLENKIRIILGNKIFRFEYV